HPLEGDVIRFIDKSTDPDPGDSVVAWDWTIKCTTANGTFPKKYSDQFPRFILSDAPAGGRILLVSLKVTDTYEESSTVSSGGLARDGTLVPQVLVGNAPPMARAVSPEVLPGGTAQLFGRFIDPGWKDTHTATFTISPPGQTPTTITGAVTEEHRRAFSTGFATATFAVGSLTGTIPFTFTVTDSDGAVSPPPAPAPYSITVAQQPTDRFEPNDVTAQAKVLPANTASLSFIQKRNDVDVYKIPLQANGEVLVTLKGLPADYDLLLLSQSAVGPPPASADDSPFFGDPFEGSSSAPSTHLDTFLDTTSADDSSADDSSADDSSADDSSADDS